MAVPTIIQSTRTYFTSEFTGQAAHALMEKKSGISKAMKAIIPLGLAGILNRSTSGKSGSQDIFDRTKNSAINLPQFHELNILKTEAETSNNKEDIFGENQKAIDEAIGRFAGIKTEAAGTLLLWALPAMMGLIGKHSLRKKLTPSGLSGYLSSQNNYIIKLIPPEFWGLETLPCFGSWYIPSFATQMKDKIEQKTNYF